MNIDDIFSGDSSMEPLVKNFRQALSLPSIYRSANTDPLGKLFPVSSSPVLPISIHPNDALMLESVGLVLDLRSDSERNNTLAQSWRKQSPGGSFVTEIPSVDTTSPTTQRKVLHIDVLSPKRLFEYMSQNWLTPLQKLQSSMYFVGDIDKLHELRMNVMNTKKLSGLYEAICKTSSRELCFSLKQITEFLESENGNQGNVVVHCVQGKDRTGIVIMLCQSIMGLSEEEMIQDYHYSEKAFPSKQNGSSVAGDTMMKGRLDRRVFSGAPKQAMRDTLDLLKKDYGSVCPGYLNSIGFDESWRNRFRNLILEKKKENNDVNILDVNSTRSRL